MPRHAFIACETNEYDLPEVIEVCQFLRRHNFVIQFSPVSDGGGGDDFYTPMEHSIERCDVYIAVVGEGIWGSTWLNKILQYAFILNKYRTVSKPSVFALSIGGRKLPPVSRNIPVEWLLPDSFDLLLEDLPSK